MPKATTPQKFFIFQDSRIYSQTAYSWQEHLHHNIVSSAGAVRRGTFILFLFYLFPLHHREHKHRTHTLILHIPIPLHHTGHLGLHGTQHRGYTHVLKLHILREPQRANSQPNVRNQKLSPTNKQPTSEKACFTLRRALLFAGSKERF